MVQGVRSDRTPKESYEEAYRKFLARKDYLRETAWRFLEDVRKRMPQREKEASESWT
jgi:hypothetical protein